MKVNTAIKDSIQKATTVIYVRFKVKVCLYLSPNNRARSLFKLITVIVNKGTPHNANAAT